MSFIAKHIIGADERLIGVARLHWIYLINGLLWSIVIMAVGDGVWMLANLYGRPGLLGQTISVLGYDLGSRFLWLVSAFGLVAVGLFLMFLIEYVSTEVALTTRRVIRKSGLIAVEVQEIELEEIDAARIRHGWLGALFGYGSIYLDCRFVGDVYLPLIKKPYRFLNALHKAQGRHEKQKTTEPA